VSADLTTDLTADPLNGLGLRLRVPTFTFASLGLALAAHVAAGGSLPGPGVLAVLALTVAAVCGVVATGERGPVSIGAAMAAVQLGVHLGLSASTVGGPPMPDEMVMAWTPGDPGAAVGQPLTMSVGHAAVGVLLTWWLARGEAATWRAVRRLVARLLPHAHHGTTAPPCRVPPSALAPAPRRRLTDELPTRRGPPLPA